VSLRIFPTDADTTFQVEIEVEHVGSRRKPHHFALKTLNVAPVESTETGPRDETWLARGRLDAEELIADGGAGVLMFYVLCNGLSASPS
jgi:hypothetical protein